jgi:hypothetical protein
MSDDWWAERQQNKRLKGLEEDLGYVSASLASARSSQNRLRAELSKVSGSIEQRLNRLSSAFDAFVEISDLRVTLGLFDAQGRVRHQAKQLLVGTPVSGDVTDVDGYWLPPALAAMLGIADGVVDAEGLALASARDARRAAVVHVLGAAVLGGRDTVPAVTLAEALPLLTEQVPRYQRAVWTLAADGFFGEAGWELARRRGVDFVRGLPDEDRSKMATALRDVAATKAVVHVPKELDGNSDLLTILQAGERLTVLRTWVSDALEGYTGEPAAAADPLARRSLELLIDEGSADELPLLARERELRAVIEGKSVESSTWDGPEGSTVELLRTDAADTEHPSRRALAVRAQSDLVLSLADGLATTARGAAPTQVSTKTRYGKVVVSTDGPDATSLAKAMTLVEHAGQVESQRRNVAYGAIVAGVLLVVLGIVAGFGWLFLAALALAVGAYQWLADTKERRTAAANVVTLKEQLRVDVDRRVEAFVKTRRELLEQQAAVDENLTAIRNALT